MASRVLITNGHEHVGAVTNSSNDTGAAAYVNHPYTDIVGVVYDDTQGTAEICAGLDLCIASLLQQAG